MKNSSIRISNRGNTIRMTGAAAQSFLNHLAAQHDAKHTHVNNGVNDNCLECGKDLRDEIHVRICPACECPIDQNGCGCNPHDA